MAKKGGSQTVTSTSDIDSTTKYYRDQALAAAGAASGLAPYGSSGFVDPRLAPGQVPSGPYMTGQGGVPGVPGALGPQQSNNPGRAEMMRAANDPNVPGPVREALRKALASMPAGAGAGGAGGPGGYTLSPAWNDPYTQQALGVYGAGANLGMGALGALGGDAEAFGKFMNPYENRVIDRMTDQFGQMRSHATMDLNDQATQARAFGGSRHGIALGARLGELDRTEADAKANLYHTGFESAQQRAFQAANLGLGAAGPLAGLGEHSLEMNDPNIRRAMLLQRFMGGMPYGTSQTSTQPISRNVGGGALGGALTGSEVWKGLQYGGPWGALAGGLLGSGLFG